VTWPLDGGGAGVDLVLIQTSLVLSCECTQLALKQLFLHNKSSEVCVKTGSTQALLPSGGRATEQTIVKWSIASDYLVSIFKENDFVDTCYGD